MKRFILAAAITMSFAASAAEVGATCTFDSDCSSALICRHNRKKGADGKLRLTETGTCQKGSHANRTERPQGLPIETGPVPKGTPKG